VSLLKIKILSIVFLSFVSAVGSAHEADETSTLEKFDEKGSHSELVKFFTQYRPGFLDLSKEIEMKSDSVKKASEALVKKWNSRVAELIQEKNRDRAESLRRVMTAVKKGGDIDIIRITAEIWFIRYGSSLNGDALKLTETQILSWINQSVKFAKKVDEGDGLTKAFAGMMLVPALVQPPLMLLTAEMAESMADATAKRELLHLIGIDQVQAFDEYVRTIDEMFKTGKEAK
jgi:hypothetical protein